MLTPLHARFSGSRNGVWLAALWALAMLSAAFGQSTSADAWKPIEQAMGRAGTVQADGVLKFGLPRSDLRVSVGALEVKPALALGAWVAFMKSGEQALVMGDLVLTEEEVERVADQLQQGGVEIAALHNHLLSESPRVMYMHIHGHGDALKLAQAVRAALAETKTPAPAAAPAMAKIEMDTAAMEQILGRPGRVNGGVFQVAVPRKETIAEMGVAIPSSMGLATAINLQPLAGGRAAATGDFVLLGAEVNPVIRALRANGIAITALHSHLLEEQPRLFFLHFWAVDDARKLARGLRTALDLTR